MTNTIRHDIPDYEVGRAQKGVYKAARESGVEYVNHKNWGPAEEIRWWQDAGLWRRFWAVSGIGLLLGLVSYGVLS